MACGSSQEDAVFRKVAEWDNAAGHYDGIFSNVIREVADDLDMHPADAKHKYYEWKATQEGSGPGGKEAAQHDAPGADEDEVLRAWDARARYDDETPASDAANNAAAGGADERGRVAFAEVDSSYSAEERKLFTRIYAEHDGHEFGIENASLPSALRAAGVDAARYDAWKRMGRPGFDSWVAADVLRRLRQETQALVRQQQADARALEPRPPPPPERGPGPGPPRRRDEPPHLVRMRAQAELAEDAPLHLDL